MSILSTTNLYSTTYMKHKRGNDNTSLHVDLFTPPADKKNGNATVRVSDHPDITLSGLVHYRPNRPFPFIFFLSQFLKIKKS